VFSHFRQSQLLELPRKEKSKNSENAIPSDGPPAALNLPLPYLAVRPAIKPLIRPPSAVRSEPSEPMRSKTIKQDAIA